ncbi:uncharacterized protein LOC105702773 isoform X2 [Orussus abietinus]|uniref:uncharacterized protein LOC105702773 isoform X2 n=1 Tax=Orussus abietinus TaxID=222816 RepID=UPI0006254436|nr:uncharacterized protein LOC105702773 isoform X2 [Orussus abietinus]
MASDDRKIPRNAYFTLLKSKCKQFDEKLEKLSESLKQPNILFCDDPIKMEEAIQFATRLVVDVKKLEEEMKSNAIARKKYIEEMDKYYNDCQRNYNTLKDQVHELETVFKEFGYDPEQIDNADRSNDITDESEVEASNALCPAERKDVVEFTPDMTWKYKPKTNDGLSNDTDSKNVSSKQSFLSPEVLTSGLQAQPLQYTPYRNCPQKPIFSKHFYSSTKK